MNKAGELIINLSGEAMYKSFKTSPLPPELEIDEEMISLLISATKSLATLNTLSTYIPNINLFVSMYVCKKKSIIIFSNRGGDSSYLRRYYGSFNRKKFKSRCRRCY